MTHGTQEERIEELCNYITRNIGYFSSKGNKYLFAKHQVWHMWRFISEVHGPFLPELQDAIYEEMKAMVSAAGTSDAAFMASKQMVARYIASGMQMPEFLAEFAIQYLMGVFKPPKPVPAPESQMFPRDTVIWQLVEIVLRSGANTKEEAYQNVATALRLSGVRKNNPSSVKKTYLRYRKEMRL